MEVALHEIYNISSVSSSEIETFSNATAGNVTGLEGTWKDDVKPILDYLLMVILIVVMLAMGCEVTWMSIWIHVKRPIGLGIGLFSQFGVKPLCAFAILKIGSISGLYATGVLIIACCPGGVLSNTFTYFIDGDLGLSIAMTSASTIMAMALMPANLWLYGRSFESEELVIPYKEMALSLVSVTSPVIVGMILKWKVPSVAKWVAKIGSYSGLIIMFTCIAIELIVFPNMFDDVPPELYILVVVLPILGLSLGYFLAFLGRQNVPVRKTVAIECGVQNVPIALTIITMSFPLEMQEDIILLPWLYGFTMVIGCSIMCLVYHYFKRRSERQNRIEKTESAVRDDTEMEEKKDLMNPDSIKIELKPSKMSVVNGNSSKTTVSV